MEIWKRHNQELERDIAECQKLAETFFEGEMAGTYKREVYAPLDFAKIETAQPAIPCFLRIATSVENNSQAGSIEMVEYFSNGESAVRSAYAANDKGDFHSQTSQFALPVSPKLAWPTVFFAPQIMSCLEGLKNPNSDPEIEPSELLDELIDIPDSENHIVQKNIEDIEADGFSLSMSYTKHAMPAELATVIRKGEPFCERYSFKIVRNGKINNDIYFSFGADGRLKEFKDTKNRNPNKTVADLAAFSRMVLN